MNKVTTSNEKGEFVFINIKPGKYHLHITAVGFKAKDVDIVHSQNSNPIQIQLTSANLEIEQVLIEDNFTRTRQREQTQDMMVATREMIEKNMGTTLMNTLDRLPGVSTINTGTGISKPVIRGMAFNRVVVAENGIKQEGQQWGGDHGLELDQFNVESVEIIKGPSSLLYGSDAIGGVVVIKPGKAPALNTVEGGVQTLVRTNNDLIGISAMAAINKNNNFFRFRASIQDYADYRVPADSFTYNTFVLPLENRRLKNTAGNEKNFNISTGISRNWGYTQLNVSYYELNAGLFPGSHGIPRAYQLLDDLDPRNIDLPNQEVKHLKIISNSNIKIGKNWLETDLGFQRNHRTENSFPHAHGFGPQPQGTKELEFILHTFSANFRLHQSISKFTQMIYGVSGVHQQNQIGGFSFLIPEFTQTTAGGFAYLKHKKNEKLNFNTGVRYDIGNINSQEHFTPIYASDTVTIIGFMKRAPNLDRFFHNVSGGTGLSYSPTQFVNLKVNLGSSFRLPTAPELTANGVHHGSFRHEMGDTSLNSERGYQLDFTFSYEKNSFLFKFSPYFSYFDQFIFLDPTPNFSPLPDASLIYRFNQANSIHTGFEMLTDIHIFENLHLEFTSQYLFAHNLESGYALPFITPGNITAEIEYEMNFLPKFFQNPFVSIFNQYTFAQNRVARNEPETPGFYLLNIGAGSSFQWGKLKPRFVFNIQNVLNSTYFAHLNRWRILNLPEPGRNYQISLVIPFSSKI